MKRTILILAIVMIFCGLSLSPIYIYGSGRSTTSMTSPPDPSWIDYYPEGNYGVGMDMALYSGVITAIGQSITGDGRTLDHVKFYLKKAGSPPGTCVAKVYNETHSEGFGIDSIPNGAALKTSGTYTANNLTTDYQLINFNFSSPQKLTEGSYYIITLEYSGGDSSNKIFMAYDESFPTHPGNSCYHFGAGWSGTAADDYIFYAISDQTYGVPDTTGPSLSITSHSEGQHVTTSSITLAGTASDSGKGDNGIQQVTVNGAQASSGTATGSGTANWNKVVYLNAGGNAITIIAYDNSTSYNTTTQSITIYYDVPDTIGPSLSITSHSNGQHVTTSSITLAGTASDAGKGDNGIQQVTVNGVQASNGTATGSGTASWSRVVSLSAGANTLTVIAYDNSANHNTTTQSITIYYDVPDTAGPSLSITSHSNGQHVITSSITLAGTASDSGKGDNGIQQVTVNGAQTSSGTATGSGTANWSKVVSLNAGANTITVIAYDNSTNHNTTTQSLTIYYDVPDTTAPSLSITSHSDGQHVSASSMTLAGTASDSGKGDNGIQQVTVNGAQASSGTATGSGTANWSKVVSLNAGANTISVIAYDNSTNHNTTTQSLTIYYDVPDTTITGGPSGTINYNNPTFTYTGSDNVTPTPNLVYATYLQGYDSVWSIYSSSTSKSYSNLPNGSYIFLVKAKDQAGNEDPTPATRSFTVNYIQPFPFKDDFSTDKGWTGYEPGGWERRPAVAGGGENGNPDPGKDYSASEDNYILGFAIGADYPNDLLIEKEIISPPVNCTGQSRVFLKFWRYLNVESNYYDHAKVYVSNDGTNWIQLWENPVFDLIDNQWIQVVYDISSVAANQATVYVKFTMGPTNASGRYSGWNIDDLEVTPDYSGPMALYVPSGDSPDPNIDEMPIQKGLGIKHFNEIPTDLSDYDLLIVSKYEACNSYTASCIKNFVQNGGGAIIMSSTPKFLAGNTNDLSSIRDWFGAGTYGNDCGYAIVSIPNPFGTDLLVNDTLDYTPMDTCQGASVYNLNADSTIISAWNGGGTHSFIHSFGQGRVFYYGGNPGYCEDPNPKIKENSLKLFEAGLVWAANSLPPPPDIIAPSVLISSPTNGANVSGGITINVSATDDVGVSKVEFYINGILYANHSTEPYNFYWNTNNYSNGPYNLEAVAYDSSENMGESNLVTVYVDNFKDTIPPVVSITLPSQGSPVSKKVTIQVIASDNVGIGRIELFIDNVLKRTVSLGTRNVSLGKTLSYNWNTAKASKGPHVISTKAFDLTGNVSTDSVTVYK
jgi:hypothetical protein